MITKNEIIEAATNVGLQPNVVEKDYVLGWILAGIYNNQTLSKSWVFKGGTCLKKCFFETYRFSEDLDFTVTDSYHFDEKFLIATFQSIALWIYQNSGIEIPIDSIFFEMIKTLDGKISSQGKLGYIGPLARRGNISKIKLDLTLHEILVLEPAKRRVYHPYSDEIRDGFNVHCYSFEEIFAEKVRALIERARPRDLYDVIHLFRNLNLLSSPKLLKSTLNKKCDFKGLQYPTIIILEEHSKREELTAEWDNMLRHQLQALPPIDSYWDELPTFFQWLNEGILEEIQSYASKAEETIWVLGRTSRLNTSQSILEKIQFAAANRVCIRLQYSDKSRTIEPYSFRKSNDGNILLYGHERESPDKEIKCYRLDRFQRVEITNQPFTARFKVEISSNGPIYMPI